MYFLQWGKNCDSAGTAVDAEITIDIEHIIWADIIFVMEKIHFKKLQNMFGAKLKDKKIITLNIKDNYKYMDKELIDILKEKLKYY